MDCGCGFRADGIEATPILFRTANSVTPDSSFGMQVDVLSMKHV